MSHYIIKIEINKYFWYVVSGIRYSKGKINIKRAIGGIKGSCYNPNSKPYTCNKYKKVRELISKEDFNINNLTITVIKDEMDKKEANKVKTHLCQLSIPNQYFMDDIYTTPEDKKKKRKEANRRKYLRHKKSGYYQQEETKRVAQAWKERNPNYQNDYNRNRYNTDIQFKTMIDIRNRLNQYLKIKNISKTNTSVKSIGCSPKMLGDWIKFNLELDNLSKYHLDHLRPLASFNCKDYDDVINSKCNHWTNIIPLSPYANLLKHDRAPTKHELFKQELRVYIFLQNQSKKS